MPKRNTLVSCWSIAWNIHRSIQTYNKPFNHQTTSLSTIRLLTASFNDRTHIQRLSVLPKRLITVFGTESSGSTFLATTLGIATGVFPKNGKQVTLPSDRYNNTGRTIVQRTVSKRARSANGDIEIQHLSLPWGWW